MVRYASTFLSHSWAQKPFVVEVGRELLRRGVLAWIDANELPVGVDLDVELRNAAAAQFTMTAFLSEESVASRWCRDELEPRLRSTPPNAHDAIVPVFLGDAVLLVKKWPLLADRWLTADQQAPRKLYVAADTFETAVPSMIAARVADGLFERLGTRTAPRVIMVLDQRGGGRRVSTPGEDLVPPNWQSNDWPALVFRPDAGERSEGEVLTGATWIEVRDALIAAIGSALGTHTRRQFYISGNAQLALAWLLGTRVDRSTLAHLVVRNGRTGQTFTLDQGEDRFRVSLPLFAESEVIWCAPRPAGGSPTVSVALVPSNYLDAIHTFRASAGDTTPLAFRETAHLSSGEDVVTLARWLGTAARQADVRLYTALPFEAVVLLAALTKHLVGRVTVFERDRANNTYVACPMQGT